jgi:glucosylglycerate synthase
MFIPDYEWAKLVYDFMIAYNKHEIPHENLLDSLTPLYFIRIADLMNRTLGKTNQQSDLVINQQAEVFMKEKEYLVRKWKEQFTLAGV